MRLIIEIDKDVYDYVKSCKDLDKGRGSEYPEAKALFAIQQGGIIQEEERECEPIEGIPLEEIVN